MKKINFIKIVVIVIICYPAIVNASSCGEILDSNTCKNTSGCSWGYNGGSDMYCYSDASSVKNAIENSSSNNNNTSSEKQSPLDFCASTASIWQIVGWVFLIVKIIVPLLLIIFGIKDLAQAVISGKYDGIKNATKSLFIRGISAILIFFVPTIVSLIMGLVVDFTSSGAKADYDICETCILNPSKCDTSKDVGKQ